MSCHLAGRRVLGAALALAVFGLPLQSGTLRLWTTEDQPDRLERQQALADQYSAISGTSVEVIPISEKDMGHRARAADAVGELPDVIYHPLQYALPWAEAGILDTEAANEIIADLDAYTFAQGVISMISFRGQAVSVPVDGWTQMIFYRKDLFEQHGLAPPHSYADVQAALDRLHNPPDMYGFVAATKVDESYMGQALEYVFLANGVSPVDVNGLRELDAAKTSEVLKFYKAIAKASPPGELYWKQSRELYFAGRAAMIIWSPFLLDELAGLRDNAPPKINDDPTSLALAEKTGIVTNFSGPSNPRGAAWADVRYFGITKDANTDAAKEFVKFAMGAGYTQTLAIAPEGKFPVRRGTVEDPTAFTEAWAKLPVGVDRKAALGDLYEQSMIDEITGGLNVAKRWGVREGQLSLASKITNSQVINRVVRQFIDDEISVEAAVEALNAGLSKIE